MLHRSQTHLAPSTLSEADLHCHCCYYWSLVLVMLLQHQSQMRLVPSMLSVADLHYCYCCYY